MCKLNDKIVYVLKNKWMKKNELYFSEALYLKRQITIYKNNQNYLEDFRRFTGIMIKLDNYELSFYRNSMPYHYFRNMH